MMRLRLFRSICVFALGVAVSLSQADAGEVRVAVAANFIRPAREIGALFEKQTGHTVKFSFASTGQLYAQIMLDAPFDIFLSADRKRAMMAAENGFADPASQFTYATGRLALFSPVLDLNDPVSILRKAEFSHLAIANPKTAPYGAAAVEAMKALGVFQALEAKLVRANSIAQTYQFIETGNAELGFVALSQVVQENKRTYWLVPAHLYVPIEQNAVLLNKAEQNEAARSFMRFLKSEEAKGIKTRFGYE